MRTFCGIPYAKILMGSSILLVLMSTVPLLGQQPDEPERQQIGMVLGRAVFQDEIRTGQNIRVRDELHRLFTAPVMEKYRQEHKVEIEPTEEEIAAAAAYFNRKHPESFRNEVPELRARIRTVDDQLARDDLSVQQRRQLDAERRALQAELDMPGRFFALFVLNNWKFQKHLYEQFGGGRILWQQAGTEAFDATRAWLETLEKRGDFQFTDRQLRSIFYEYWTTMDHGSFLTGDNRQVQRGFLEPEWRVVGQPDE